MIAYVKFCKKIKVPTLPLFQFFFFFFFQKIDERLNEIRRSQKSCTSRSIDFTLVKLKTRSMPFTMYMYVRESGAASPIPDLRPFAGRPLPTSSRDVRGEMIDEPPVECFHIGRPARQNGNKGQITIPILGLGSRTPNPEPKEKKRRVTVKTTDNRMVIGT